jgi:hypothetical protein
MSKGAGPSSLSLPFLTLPDPLESGEGALDPLGMATIGDRLADWLLPGMTARMSRPRFLTAIAVSAAVCDGLEDQIGSDGITPAYLVFEWLVVEAFVREATAADVRGTPGTLKVAQARKTGIPLSAKAYLKTPSVFGFHGIYKRLARHVGIIDEDFRLGDSGYSLLKIWEREQGVEGFLDSALSRTSATGTRQVLRSAVERGLEVAYTDRSGGWQGWEFLARHLAPASVGKREATFIRTLLTGVKGETRGEIIQLVGDAAKLNSADEVSEAVLVDGLLGRCSQELGRRFRTVIAYEELCRIVEDAFDWLRYLSTHAGARTIGVKEFAAVAEIGQAASILPGRLQSAERALDGAPLDAQHEFAKVAEYVDGVTCPEDLYHAVLHRHADVQQSKPPEGKRQWFEYAADGSVLLRLPYRLHEQPSTERDWWGRPYRLDAVRSFCDDLGWETA